MKKTRGFFRCLALGLPVALSGGCEHREFCLDHSHTMLFDVVFDCGERRMMSFMLRLTVGMRFMAARSTLTMAPARLLFIELFLPSPETTTASRPMASSFR